MADPPRGSPAPAPRTAQGTHQRTPSAQHRRNPAQSHYDAQRSTHLDGSVSDSVASHMASPRSKKAPKQSNGNATGAAQHMHNPPIGKTGTHKQRHGSGSGGAGSGDNNIVPMTPLKESAYAGATFQASPAPSSLPVPKFFAKSMSASRPTMEARLMREQSPITEKSSPETDTASPYPPPRATQQSPLDVLFKADRAERDRSSSGAGLRPVDISRQTPPATEPRHIQQHPGRNAFLHELDGDDSDFSGPKSLPNQHSYVYPGNRAASSSGPNGPYAPPPTTNNHDTYTKSLKDLLFNNSSAQPPQGPPPSQPRPHSQTPTSDFEGIFGVPSPSGPSTPVPPAPSAEQQPDYYSLHYGNRNLSPLFKAARNDTTPRPPSSPLRQHALATEPAGNAYTSGHASSRTAEANRFSREFLDQQIRSSQPGAMHHSSGGHSVRSASQPQATMPPAPRNGHANANAGNTNVSAPRDVRVMEDDLRRMLNLNVLSG